MDEPGWLEHVVRELALTSKRLDSVDTEETIRFMVEMGLQLVKSFNMLPILTKAGASELLAAYCDSIARHAASKATVRQPVRSLNSLGCVGSNALSVIVSFARSQDLQSLLLVNKQSSQWAMKEMWRSIEFQQIGRMIKLGSPRLQQSIRATASCRPGLSMTEEAMIPYKSHELILRLLGDDIFDRLKLKRLVITKVEEQSGANCLQWTEHLLRTHAASLESLSLSQLQRMVRSAEFQKTFMRLKVRNVALTWYEPGKIAQILPDSVLSLSLKSFTSESLDFSDLDRFKLKELQLHKGIISEDAATGFCNAVKELRHLVLGEVQFPTKIAAESCLCHLESVHLKIKMWTEHDYSPTNQLKFIFQDGCMYPRISRLRVGEIRIAEDWNEIWSVLAKTPNLVSFQITWSTVELGIEFVTHVINSFPSLKLLRNIGFWPNQVLLSRMENTCLIHDLIQKCPSLTSLEVYGREARWLGNGGLSIREFIECEKFNLLRDPAVQRNVKKRKRLEKDS
jgi:hypothetical protein